MRGTACGGRQHGVGAEADSINGLRLGYEREEGDDADKRGRGGSDTEREEKDEAASTSAGWAGPLSRPTAKREEGRGRAKRREEGSWLSARS
jgi:hypothetical protein